MLGSSQGFSWETCEGAWGAWGCIEMSRCVLGILQAEDGYYWVLLGTIGKTVSPFLSFIERDGLRDQTSGVDFDSNQSTH